MIDNSQPSVSQSDKINKFTHEERGTPDSSDPFSILSSDPFSTSPGCIVSTEISSPDPFEILSSNPDPFANMFNTYSLPKKDWNMINKYTVNSNSISTNTKDFSKNSFSNNENGFKPSNNRETEYTAYNINCITPYSFNSNHNMQTAPTPLDNNLFNSNSFLLNNISKDTTNSEQPKPSLLELLRIDSRVTSQRKDSTETNSFNQNHEETKPKEVHSVMDSQGEFKQTTTITNYTSNNPITRHPVKSLVGMMPTIQAITKADAMAKPQVVQEKVHCDLPSLGIGGKLVDKLVVTDMQLASLEDLKQPKYGLALSVFDENYFYLEWAAGVTLHRNLYESLRTIFGAESMHKVPFAELKYLERMRKIFFHMSRYESILETFNKAHINVEPIPPYALHCIPNWSNIAPVLNITKKVAMILDRTGEEVFPLNSRIASVVYPYQREAVEFALKTGGRLLLADEMGLGKTVQALAIVSHFISQWPILIIAPSGVRNVWVHEIQAFLPKFGFRSVRVYTDKSKKKKSKAPLILMQEEPVEEVIEGNGPEAVIQVIENSKDSYNHEANIFIISYDLLSRKNNEVFCTSYTKKPFRVIICDEAHMLKNFNSERTKVILPMVQFARHVIMLTGTPVLNQASDLYSTFTMLLPGLFPQHKEFCTRYCDEKLIRLAGRQTKIWAGTKRPYELHSILVNTVMLRRLKDEVCDQLPAKVRQVLTLSSNKLKKTVLEAIANSMDAWSRENETMNKEPSESQSSIFKLTAEAKIDAVKEVLSVYLESGTKSIIFAHHHIMLDELEAFLTISKISFVRIDGTSSKRKRDQAVDDFCWKPNPGEDSSATGKLTVQVALLSVSACATGLNLHTGGCSTVFFAELYWVPGILQQAEDRVHRVGQRETVNIYYLIAENTLDPLIYKSLEKKFSANTSVLNGGVGDLYFE